MVEFPTTPGTFGGYRGWAWPQMLPSTCEVGQRGEWQLDPSSSLLGRIANSNNMNKSESDQEDNDDINDNDWSYGSEKRWCLGIWGIGRAIG